jgi:hypothetical protein
MRAIPVAVLAVLWCVATVVCFMVVLSPVIRA